VRDTNSVKERNLRGEGALETGSKLCIERLKRDPEAKKVPRGSKSMGTNKVTSAQSKAGRTSKRGKSDEPTNKGN